MTTSPLAMLFKRLDWCATSGHGWRFLVVDLPAAAGPLCVFAAIGGRQPWPILGSVAGRSRPLLPRRAVGRRDGVVWRAMPVVGVPDPVAHHPSCDEALICADGSEPASVKA